MKKLDTVKLIGFAGMILGFVATQIGNWASEKTMEQTIDEKVREAILLAEANEEESE